MIDPITELYSKEVLQHFRHPKNMGAIKNPDGFAKVGNPVCGDIMCMYLRVGDKEGEKYIKDVKFQTLGCGAAIATSSMMTVLVKGKTLNDAAKVSKTALIKALGGLPAPKIHCSVLAEEAFKKALQDYKSKLNVD